MQLASTASLSSLSPSSRIEEVDEGLQDSSASGGAQVEIHRAANVYLRKMQLGTAHPQEAEVQPLAPVGRLFED